MVGKANSWINVEKIIIGLNNSKLKFKKVKKKKKKKIPQNCKSPMQRQRFITAIKKCDWEKKSSKA